MGAASHPSGMLRDHTLLKCGSTIILSDRHKKELSMKTIGMIGGMS